MLPALYIWCFKCSLFSTQKCTVVHNLEKYFSNPLITSNPFVSFWCCLYIKKNFEWCTWIKIDYLNHLLELQSLLKCLTESSNVNHILAICSGTSFFTLLILIFSTIKSNLACHGAQCTAWISEIIGCSGYVLSHKAFWSQV